MNWDRLEGEWKQRRGKAVRYWGKVMNDELAAIAGKYEELVGRLQSRYGVAREEAQRQDGKLKRLAEQLEKSKGQLIRAQKALSQQKGASKKRTRSARPMQKRKWHTPGKATS